MNSRDKGARGERELSNLLKTYGYENAKRGQQYCGLHGDADVVGIDGLHIECKRVEKLNIDKALNQSIRDAKNEEIPIVVHRKNKENWKVSISLENFIKIYKIYEKYKNI